MGELNILDIKADLEKNNELLDRLNAVQDELTKVREYIESNIEGEK